MDLKSRWSCGGLLSKASAIFFRFACNLGPRDLKTENWISVGKNSPTHYMGDYRPFLQ